MDYVRSFNLRKSYLSRFIRRALKEDIGTKDITTEILIPKNQIAKAVLQTKENCVICGLNIAR